MLLALSNRLYSVGNKFLQITTWLVVVQFRYCTQRRQEQMQQPRLWQIIGGRTKWETLKVLPSRMRCRRIDKKPHGCTIACWQYYPIQSFTRWLKLYNSDAKVQWSVAIIWQPQWNRTPQSKSCNELEESISIFHSNVSCSWINKVLGFAIVAKRLRDVVTAIPCEHLRFYHTELQFNLYKTICHDFLEIIEMRK